MIENEHDSQFEDYRDDNENETKKKQNILTKKLAN